MTTSTDTLPRPAPAAPAPGAGECATAAPSQPLDAPFAIGAHLLTARRGYIHHGIYVGADRVVHYAGLSRSLVRGPIEEVTLAYFACGREVSVKARGADRFSAVEAVARARSRLGEDRYRLTTNNCEHFCEWCLSGTSRSEQVEQCLERVRGLIAAAARTLGRVLGGRPRASPELTSC